MNSTTLALSAAGVRPAKAKSTHMSSGRTGLLSKATHMQKETTHTPGPWKAVIPINGMTPIYGSDETIQGGDPYQIGWVITEDRNSSARKTDIANAQLIAAAPELLEACKELLECDNGNADAMHKHWTERCKANVRAAIAKAERGQS